MTWRPEFWHGISIGPAQTLGTTCAQTFGGIDFMPASLTEFMRVLDEMEAHCRLSAASEREDVRDKGREGLALLAQLPAAIPEAAEVAFRLGRFWEEWRAKDATEAHFDRGIRNLRARLKATPLAAAAKAKKARRRRKPQLWRRAVESRPRQLRGATVARIAEQEGLSADAIEKAIQRDRKRRPAR